MTHRRATVVLMGLAFGVCGCASSDAAPARGVEPGEASAAALGTTWSVCEAGAPSCDFSSLQDAIDAANPRGGDTITVAPGVYAESMNFTVDKPLTLLGAGANVAPIEGGRTSGETRLVSSQDGALAILHVTADHVIVNGFEFADGQTSIAVPVATGVTRHDLTFSYNWIHTNQLRRAIALNSHTSERLSNVRIEHNLITASASHGDANHRALVEFGGDSTTSNVAVANNVFRNRAPKGRFLSHSGHPGSYLVDAFVLTRNVVDAGAFNMGNIANGTVTGNVFRDGVAVGLAGGVILANAFLDGGYLSLWGHRRGFTRPSRDLRIANNAFGLDGALWLDEPGVDLASLVVTANGFAAPPCAAAPATQTRGLLYGPSACDAVLHAPANGWSGAPDSSVFQGFQQVVPTPWITGLRYTGATSFGFPAPVLLQATIAHSDGSHPATPVAFFVDGRFVGSAPAGVDGVASLAWAPPSLGSYAAVAYAGLGTTPVDIRVRQPTTPTSLAFTGPWLDADGDGTSTLGAVLSSTAAACIEDKPVQFAVRDASGTVFENTAHTDSEGRVVVTWTHAPERSGGFEVQLTFAGDAECEPSRATDVVTLARPGDWARGAGHYEPSDAPGTRARFAFVAKSVYDGASGTYAFAGGLRWVHDAHQKFESTSITSVRVPRVVSGKGTCTDVSGVGTLAEWDTRTSTFTAGVSTGFVATACDARRSGGHHHPGATGEPDSFGIMFPTVVVLGASGPVPLREGRIKVR
jgi:hypothetical protein